MQETTETIRSMQYTRYHRTRRNTEDKGYNILRRNTPYIWSEVPDLRSKILKQYYSSALTPHSDHELWRHWIFTPPRPITLYTSSATPRTPNMSYERQPYMARKCRTSGWCLIHDAWCWECLDGCPSKGRGWSAVTSAVNRHIWDCNTTSWARTSRDLCWIVFAQNRVWAHLVSWSVAF